MTTVLYNCKRCKVGLRVEYPLRAPGYFAQAARLDESGAVVCSGVWVERCGGGRPTVYGGDPLGVCTGCGKAMSYGPLVATVRESVRCDARCIGSRGPKCDCSCGGKNHGAGWSQVGKPLAEVML